MNIDLNNTPPDLEISLGDSPVVFKHLYFNGAERMAILDLLTTDWSAAFERSIQKVVGVDGLLDADNKPIPKGKINDLIGLLKFEQQIDLFSQQLVLNGTPFKIIQNMVERLLSKEDAEAVRQMADELGKLPFVAAKKSSTD